MCHSLMSSAFNYITIQPKKQFGGEDRGEDLDREAKMPMSNHLYHLLTASPNQRLTETH